MKIVLIITGLGMGGAERQVSDLADQFTEHGHKVLLISLTGEVANRPHSNLVDLVAINMSKTPAGFIRAFWQVRKIVKIFQPDVVHSHMFHANLFARLLRLTVPMAKLICSAHSSNEGGRLRMLAYRITDHLCDLSTNVSQEAVDIFVRRGAASKTRIIAMYNGIDTDRFHYSDQYRAKLRSELSIADSTLLVLAVGRLTKAKDYPNLLTAFSLLSKSFDNVQLVIIGTGEQQMAIVALAEQLGLSKRVRFLGLRYDVHQWMSAADLFVLSSAWEGFGLVVAEAMACERMVVATDCGGVKEVLGDCGILVPAHDSLALGRGLVKGLELSRDPTYKQARLARLRVINNYSLNTQAERWLALYK